MIWHILIGGISVTIALVLQIFPAGVTTATEAAFLPIPQEFLQALFEIGRFMKFGAEWFGTTVTEAFTTSLTLLVTVWSFMASFLILRNLRLPFIQRWTHSRDADK